MIGAISARSSFSHNGLSLSGPAALPGFKLFNNFRIPFRDMSMSDRTDVVVRYSGGMVAALRKHAYSNTLKILPPKNDNFFR